MPTDLTKPVGTESLPNEDWCPSCEHDVPEWDVYMEDDGEGGYEKIHRCPNCNEKALQNQSSGADFILFSVFYYGSIIFAFAQTENEDLRLVLLIGGIILGFGVLASLAWLKKKWLYRKRCPPKPPVDPFDVTDSS